MSGTNGAYNAVNHWATKGIDPRKFYILEGGGTNWPYADMLEVTPKSLRMRKRQLDHAARMRALMKSRQ